MRQIIWEKELHGEFESPDDIGWALRYGHVSISVAKSANGEHLNSSAKLGELRETLKMEDEGPEGDLPENWKSKKAPVPTTAVPTSQPESESVRARTMTYSGGILGLIKEQTDYFNKMLVGMDREQMMQEFNEITYALQDVVNAANAGQIPKEYMTSTNLLLITSYVFDGVNRSSDPKIATLGNFVLENYSKLRNSGTAPDHMPVHVRQGGAQISELDKIR